MALPRLIVLTRRVLRDIERRFGPRRAPLRRHLREVVRSLLLARVTVSLQTLAEQDEVRGLRTHLTQLGHYLARGSYLPEALCAHYRYRMSRARSQNRYGISDTEWVFVHRLAGEAGLDLEALYHQSNGVDVARCPWHDALEEGIEDVVVSLDLRAFDDMLLCALEGYLSPLAGRAKGREVCGINLGMTSERREEKRGVGGTVTRFVHVARSQPQMSALGTMREVGPNITSIEVLLDAAHKLFPQYDVVGDFHSHPFDSLEQMRAHRGWRYSPEDERSGRDWFDVLADLGARPWVTFVVAVARNPRSVRLGPYRGLPNTVQTSAGNCRIVVAAYRVLGSGAYSARNIRLHIPGIQG